MYHVLLVLVSVSQSWPKAVCWSVLHVSPSGGQTVLCPAGPNYSYQPGQSLAGGSLLTLPHIPHTTLPAGSIIVWSGLISGLCDWW